MSTMQCARWESLCGDISPSCQVVGDPQRSVTLTLVTQHPSGLPSQCKPLNSLRFLRRAVFQLSHSRLCQHIVRDTFSLYVYGMVLERALGLWPLPSCLTHACPLAPRESFKVGEWLPTQITSGLRMENVKALAPPISQEFQLLEPMEWPTPSEKNNVEHSNNFGPAASM